MDAKEIIRFDPKGDAAYMLQAQEGRYVTFENYVSLHDENEALKKRLSAAGDSFDEQCNNLERELAQVKEERDRLKIMWSGGPIYYQPTPTLVTPNTSSSACPSVPRASDEKNYQSILEDDLLKMVKRVVDISRAKDELMKIIHYMLAAYDFDAPESYRKEDMEKKLEAIKNERKKLNEKL